MFMPHPSQVGSYPFKFPSNPYVKSEDNVMMPPNTPCPPIPATRTNGRLGMVARVAENSLQNSVVGMTQIENESIASFVVGGEKRLCWNNLVETVLKNFSLQEVNKKKSDLRIYTSVSSFRQLQTLQAIGVLPVTQTHCMLISKSDAARLCSNLLRPPVKDSSEISRFGGIDVTHDCFGGCSGTFITERYTHVNAQCIQCSQCGSIFTPHQFVTHNHKGFENRLCHWGFDSAEWRTYLQLADEDPSQELLDEWKGILSRKFDNSTVNYKRIASDASEGAQSKKLRVEQTIDKDTVKKINNQDDTYCKNITEKEVDDSSSSASRPQFTGEVIARVIEKSEMPTVDMNASRNSSGKELPLVASDGLTDTDISENGNLMGLAKICSEVVKSRESDSDEEATVDVELPDDNLVNSKALRLAERKIAKLEMLLKKANRKNYELQEKFVSIHDGKKVSNVYTML